MCTHPFRALLLAMVSALVAPATQSLAQYYDQGAIQKNFETADFFFTPNYVNPFGLEGFGPGLPGLVGERLLDLQLSPSLVRGDSARGTYAYLDFRSARSRTQGVDYPIYALRDGPVGMASRDMAIYPYPGYWQSSYRLAEPVMSAALFTRPAPRLLPDLTAGFTYSLVTTDQSYYDVPSGIYRGLETADAAAQAGVPVTDVYSGSDQMHTIGHFPTLAASYAAGKNWNVGARLSFARFERDGEFGNYYNPGQSPWQQTSVSSQFTARNQTYNHTDVSLGVDGMIGNGAHIGFSVGRLDGDGRQVQDGGSLYRYDYGTPDDPNTAGGSTYRSGSLQDQQADRSGSSSYGTAFLRRDLDEQRRLTLTYRGTWTDLSMEGYSFAADSSRSFGQSRYDTNLYRYESAGLLWDSREGAGTGTGRTHRLSAGLEWSLNPRSRLVLGAVGTYDRQTIETHEQASVRQSSFWDNQWNEGTVSRAERGSYSRDEVKEVIWTFSNRRSSLQIPVIFWHRLSDHFEAIAGINRQMSESRIADESVAVFEYRNLEVDGRQTRERDFGERYREPTVYRTEVDTSVLLGITARPAPGVDIRLLVSPRWSTYWEGRRTQWWLGFQLRP